MPALLTDEAQALNKMVESISGQVPWAQVDIMDGQFVPSKSIGWREIKAAKLPFDWEAHLMVKEPESYFSGFKSARARRVIFHFEAVEDPRTVIEKAVKLDLEVGMAINPGTPVSAVVDFLPLLDSVLIMSVIPGFYGSKFIPEVLDKVGEIRAIRPEIPIGIDGGIKEANILEVTASGVDDICVGSGIFLSGDPAGSWRRLQALVNAAKR
ncbi:ribulose-phosphate 3-epimerase [Dehalogenimonas formicexedens]|uniref:Ribulose-phosphate 3-epimerase n=1 Tax=Dehalogenimonas formicexedens TaxID=1839801 RepID=A0A1P8F717_9CHLR|nr:ribulose-phosphate 3-epimerase [Dehalogenimonas formicexedens]